MHHVDERYHKVFREIRLIKIGHNTFFDGGGRIVFGGDGRNGTVRMVGDIIERRHINALDLCGFLQEPFPAPALPLGLSVQVQHLQVYLLPFPQEKQVEEIRHRLRVAGTGAAAHYHMRKALAVLLPQWNTGKVQHIQHTSIAQLILQGKHDDIELI